MKRIAVQKLSNIIKADCSNIKSDSFFDSICTDSRNIKQGCCFWAIKGENFDGHNFVNDSLKKGAACAVVSSDIIADTDKPILKVKDTIQALGDFANWYRTQGHYKVIAITGSVGKTTTREIIHHVLSKYRDVIQSPKSFNNNIGLPLTLLSADEKTKIIISELGTNHIGEIQYLTKIAAPDIAVITTVQPAHLEGFGSIEAIAEEKISISKGLANQGTLLINGGCRILLETCKKKNLKFKTFGKSPSCDYFAEKIVYEPFASRFKIQGKEVYLPLPGPGNIENALAAWAVCCLCEISIEQFIDALKTLKPVSMRSEILQAGSLTILNDCYNANPASMNNAIEILSNMANQQKRRCVFICGDMAELGDYSNQLHSELGEKIAAAKIDLLLTVGKFAQITKLAAKGINAQSFETTETLCNNLISFIKPADIILVKGSRIAKLELAVEKLKEFATQLAQNCK